MIARLLCLSFLIAFVGCEAAPPAVDSPIAAPAAVDQAEPSGCCPGGSCQVGERVVNLPHDSEAWYISVVGSDVDRGELLSWFDTHEGLVSLKRQVHFCSPTCDSAIYSERYAPNVSGLPTVRVQEADGTVVYEVSGEDVPKTAQCLFDGIAKNIRKRNGGCVLPWRNDMEQKCQPATPGPEEDIPVPFSAVPGTPVIDDEEAGGVPIGLVVLGALLSIACGAAGGLVVAFRKEHVRA